MELEESIKDNKITVDEAIDIVDTMYQKKMSTTEKNNVIYVDKMDDVKFIDLEVASVILLREVKSLKGQVENSISKEKIEDKIKELECDKFYQNFSDDYMAKIAINEIRDLLKE